MQKVIINNGLKNQLASKKKSASFHNEAALLGKKYHIATKLHQLFLLYKLFGHFLQFLPKIVQIVPQNAQNHIVETSHQGYFVG